MAKSGSPTVIRKVLASHPIPELPGYESRLVQLSYPPGVKAPLHNHPVAATGVVIEGTVISQWDGGEIETYTKGQGFVDLGVVAHVRSENASETEWLVMVVNYVIKIGEPNVQQLC